MPQIFQVLKCYKCFVFQIHQSKKSNKFECKMCGEKQSIKRHYGIGTGKDCRLHVQRLNSLRGETEGKSSTFSDYDEDESEDCNTNEKSPRNNKNPISYNLKRSKWTEFIDNEVDDAETKSNESMFVGDKEVVLEFPQKKIRKFKDKVNVACRIQKNSSTSINSSNSVLETEWDVVPHDRKKYPTKNFGKRLQDDNIVDVSQEHPKDIKSDYLLKQKSPPNALKIVTTSSKWAQFVKEEDENEDPKPSNCELREIISKKDSLFALCDDGDLDNVLDF